MPQYRDVRIEHGGHTYTGRFYVGGELLHVGSAYGSKSVKLGKRERVAAAEKLLREIVVDWFRK